MGLQQSFLSPNSAVVDTQENVRALQIPECKAKYNLLVEWREPCSGNMQSILKCHRCKWKMGIFSTLQDHFSLSAYGFRAWTFSVHQQKTEEKQDTFETNWYFEDLV